MIHSPIPTRNNSPQFEPFLTRQSAFQGTPLSLYFVLKEKGVQFDKQTQAYMADRAFEVDHTLWFNFDRIESRKCQDAGLETVDDVFSLGPPDMMFRLNPQAPFLLALNALRRDEGPPHDETWICFAPVHYKPKQYTLVSIRWDEDGRCSFGTWDPTGTPQVRLIHCALEHCTFFFGLEVRFIRT